MFKRTLKMKVDLPKGEVAELGLVVGDGASFVNPGAAEPFLTINRTGKRDITVTLRSDDEVEWLTDRVGDRDDFDEWYGDVKRLLDSRADRV